MEPTLPSGVKTGEHPLSAFTVMENANSLMHCAIICQKNGTVHIGQPQLLLIVDHDLKCHQDATQKGLDAVYKSLNQNHIYLEGILLQRSRVPPGYA